MNLPLLKLFFALDFDRKGTKKIKLTKKIAKIGIIKIVNIKVNKHRN